MLTAAPRQQRLGPPSSEVACQWLEALLAAAQQPPDSVDAALEAIRGPARVRMAEALAAGQALPQRRQDDWRLTDPAALLRVPPRLFDRQAAAAADPAAAAATSAVAGNGASGPLRLRLDRPGDPLAGLQLPPGLERLDPSALNRHLGQALLANRSSDHWPVRLNQALAAQLLALRVRAGAPQRLELCSEMGAGAGVLPVRILLLLEPDARLELFEQHRGGEGSLSSVLVEAELGRGAQLLHGVLGEGHQGCQLRHQAVVQEPGSALTLVQASAGWDLVRSEPRVVQSEGAARTVLRGLQWVAGRELADTHSEVRFEGPDGELDQLHKAVADAAGHSVFHGAVVVPRLAQRTAAAQISRGLLLSARARIDARPQLEIVADDVRCTHGATVSTLQPEQLFYLRSRGIAAARAARLLLRGFCDEVLRQLPAAAAGGQPSGWLPVAQEDERR
ncbi:MAG: SufD family Fe-S cluster assembly protein [Synechococcaceae cyanobacterium]|nr:SufD family Fe-S cluster assembly protein [Synechococcaceae cyanobacterium]